jgi:hypothetical protein
MKLLIRTSHVQIPPWLLSILGDLRLFLREVRAECNWHVNLLLASLATTCLACFGAGHFYSWWLYIPAVFIALAFGGGVSALTSEIVPYIAGALSLVCFVCAYSGPWWFTALGLYFCCIGWGCESSQKKEEILRQLSGYGPENVYGKSEFVDDEQLRGNHF